MSNASGSGNCAGSRFAAPTQSVTRAPAADARTPTRARGRRPARGARAELPQAAGVERAHAGPGRLQQPSVVELKRTLVAKHLLDGRGQELRRLDQPPELVAARPAGV